MITDPQRARKSDQGNPDVCNVFEFHRLYSDKDRIDTVNNECRTADIGCVECKKMMAKNLIKALEPIREKRDYYEGRPELLDEIIAEGSNKAREIAKQTMEEVRSAVKV